MKTKPFQSLPFSFKKKSAIGVLCLLVLMSLISGFKPTRAVPVSPIPTADQVGVVKLTDNIAPVKAPFQTVVFKKPTFPEFSVNIITRGAKNSGITTHEIQMSIDEVNNHGGGTVIIPAGIWTTGRISLKSNVNLHLADGAELHFSGEIGDYLPAVFTLNEGIEMMSLGAMIYANGQSNIAITGKGKIVGPTEGSIKKRYMKGDVIENVVSAAKPVAQRIYDGADKSAVFMPMCISPVNCKNVYIEGITIRNTLFWNIVPIYCDGVIIRGVNVSSTGNSRTDGIDIQSTRNVLIEYCTLSCGDDCFTIKGGRNEDGMRINKPSENIVIRYCLSLKGAGSVTCGSETAGMIRNLYVHDCVFSGTNAGILFKTRRPRGGGGENLTYERIRLNVPGDAIKFDMLGSKQFVGALANRLPALPINRLTPVYRNITARNIIVENANSFLNVTGIPESPVTGLLIENIEVTCARLFASSDTKNLVIRNAVIHSKDSLISVVDGRNMTFDRVKFDVPGNKIFSKISGSVSDSIRFIGCIPQKPEGWPNTVWGK